MSGPRPPRPRLLVSLCLAGALAFNFPLVGLWDHEATVFGLPLLPLALFAIWGLLIAALAFVSEGRSLPEGGRGEPPR